MKTVEVAIIAGKMVGGGVEAIIMAYVRHIDRDKVHFTCLVDSDSTFVPEEEILAYGADIIYIPPYQQVLKYQKALYRIFREKRFDIVHSHINTLSVFPLFAARRAGIPVRIAESHSTSGKGETVKNILKAVLRPFSRLYATKLCACCEYAGKWLFGRHADFDILPNNLDFESEKFVFDAHSRESLRKELGIEDRFAVGHVGRFMPQKNHFYLLTVFSEILKMISGAVLLLAGSGELMESVRERARTMGIEGDVIFLGQVKDTAKLYSAMDVFILPSLYEGKPLAAMEAQYASLPVVMSDRVTDETILNPESVRKLSLALSPVQWAECALSIAASSERKDSKVIKTEKSKSISAEALSDWYVSLCRESTGQKADCFFKDGRY